MTEEPDYITGSIANGLNELRGVALAEVVTPAKPNVAAVCKSGPCPAPDTEIAIVGDTFQQQRLYEVDFSKLIVSYNGVRPLGEVADSVPSGLQGVADPRAAVAHSQDFDLESSLRITSEHAFLKELSV